MTAAAVSWLGAWITLGLVANLRSDGFAQRADDSAGGGQRTEELAGIAQTVDELPIPVSGSSVEQTRGTGEGVFQRAAPVSSQLR